MHHILVTDTRATISENKSVLLRVIPGALPRMEDTEHYPLAIWIFYSFFFNFVKSLILFCQ